MFRVTFFIFYFLCDQILEMFARNDDLLVQMCGMLSSSCEVIPEELQKRFSSMYAERAEHINRRISNYRKVTSKQISMEEKMRALLLWIFFRQFYHFVQIKDK